MTEQAAVRQGGDPLEQFKAAQKLNWSQFAPLEMNTTIPAGALVKFAGVQAGQRVLDVACGTGVVAVTAARAGARVSALDLTPALLERARHNGQLAEVDVDWHEGDAENLPFSDATFDVVLSQFGHIFAPRPAVVTAEMLRVLKSGGTIAFSSWLPDQYTGRMFKLTGSYLPPPPPGVAPPPLWGDENVVRERLGSAVRDITFQCEIMRSPALSPQHYRNLAEQTSGPLVKLVEALSVGDPARLAMFRREFDALIREFFDQNFMRQDFLMTRAAKL
jgi:ubiquinone/menaquinone biosynthesis C-methylase UbiE